MTSTCKIYLLSETILSGMSGRRLSYANNMDDGFTSYIGTNSELMFCSLKLPKYLSELIWIPIPPSEILTWMIWQECCFILVKPWGASNVEFPILWRGKGVLARKPEFRLWRVVFQFGGHTISRRVSYNFSLVVYH